MPAPPGRPHGASGHNRRTDPGGRNNHGRCCSGCRADNVRERWACVPGPKAERLTQLDTPPGSGSPLRHKNRRSPSLETTGPEPPHIQCLVATQQTYASPSSFLTMVALLLAFALQ